MAQKPALKTHRNAPHRSPIKQSLSVVFLSVSLLFQAAPAYAFEEDETIISLPTDAPATLQEQTQQLFGSDATALPNFPEGAGKITLPDLTSHPLAGEKIEIEIIVSDGLDQRGKSQTITITLPKPFLVNPLNTKLADIRKELVLNPEAAPQLVKDIKDALEEFSQNLEGSDAKQALEDIADRLEKAAQSPLSENPDQNQQQNGDLNDISEDIWEAMQQLEEDTLSEAEKRLKDIQEQLKEALENGASKEELDQIMQDAQDAMQDALQEQLEQAIEQGNEESQASLENMQNMMEKIQEMMEKLAPEQEQIAQQMTEQMIQKMQQMMQESRQQQAQSGESQQSNQQNQQQAQQDMQQMMQQMQNMMQQMQERQEMSEDLQKLIEDQQDLMDQTMDQTDLTQNQKAQAEEKILDILEQLEKRANALPQAHADYIPILEKTHENEIHELRKRLDQRGTSQEDIERALQKLILDKASKREDFDQQQTEKIDKLIEDIGEFRSLVTTQKEVNKGLLSAGQVQYDTGEAERLFNRLKRLEREYPQTPQQQQDKNQTQNQTEQNQAEQGERGEQSGQQDSQSQPQQQQQTKSLQSRLNQLQLQLSQMQRQHNKLKNQQAGLNQQLEDIMRRMEQAGLDPSPLNPARDPMRTARTRISDGQPSDAVPEQNKAIQSLREGAEQMQQQMQQQQQKSMDGAGSPAPASDVKDAQGLHDPFGPNPNKTLGIRPDTGENRSREIRDIIRERLNSGAEIPPAEKRYLEDLLKGKGNEDTNILLPPTQSLRPSSATTGTAGTPRSRPPNSVRPTR